MKNIFWVVLFFVGSISSVALAQEAKLIKFKGDVLIKSVDGGDFIPAQLGMAVGQGAQVKTAINGTCTLSFDIKNKRIVNVDPNTSITIESLSPGRVFLPEGRVFALIKDIKAVGKFEVRTPAAISGARGTGWSMEHINGKSVAKCFDDVIYFANLNSKGEAIHETEIAEGFTAEVRVDVPNEKKEISDVNKGVPEEKKESVEDKKEDVVGEEKKGDLEGKNEDVQERAEILEPEIHQLSVEDKEEWSSFIEDAGEIIQEDSIEPQVEPKVEENVDEKAAEAEAGAVEEGEQAGAAHEEQPEADAAEEHLEADEGAVELSGDEFADSPEEENFPELGEGEEGALGEEIVDPLSEREEEERELFDAEDIELPNDLVRESQDDIRKEAVQQQVDQKKITDPTKVGTSNIP